MHDEPHSTLPSAAEPAKVTTPLPAGPPPPAAPSWSSEHYGFPDAPAAGQVTPPATSSTRSGSSVEAGTKPWWHRGRTLAAAGVAAAIFAVGAIGFTVGHDTADGPRDAPTANTFGPGQGGPGGRDARGH